MSDTGSQLYTKANNPTVLAVVNQNKQVYEPFSDIVDKTLVNLNAHSIVNQDSYLTEKNDEVKEEIVGDVNGLLDNESVS